MIKSEQRSYLAPELEVFEMMVEQGFAASLGGKDLDPNPNNPSETPFMPGVDTDW